MTMAKSLTRESSKELKYTLCISGEKNLDCNDSSISDIYYIAKTLSKYSSCQVDVYENQNCIKSFDRGLSVLRREAA